MGCERIKVGLRRKAGAFTVLERNFEMKFVQFGSFSTVGLKSSTFPTTIVEEGPNNIMIFVIILVTSMSSYFS